jgi:hypothetical protein
MRAGAGSHNWGRVRGATRGAGQVEVAHTRKFNRRSFYKRNTIMQYSTARKSSEKGVNR